MNHHDATRSDGSRNGAAGNRASRDHGSAGDELPRILPRESARPSTRGARPGRADRDTDPAAGAGVDTDSDSDFDADIGLLLEGTYPYVSGGVSSWVHEIVSGLPDLTFGVVFLGATPETYGGLCYRLPRNLVHVEAHYLMTPDVPTTQRPRRPRPARAAPPAVLDDLTRLHDAFRRTTPLDPALVDAAAALGAPGADISLADFLEGPDAWERICSEYDAKFPSTSFIDYFWTVRTMHRPLFKLAEIAARVPRFRLFHAVSTGYAGMLGALLQRRRRRPFLLTEHGIYTKERKIDLAHASWIKDAGAPDGHPSQLGHLRQLWIRFFEGLGRAAYATASPIVSLYEGNRKRQITDGADVARTRVIPNGIDLARFAPLRQRRPAAPPPVLGLIGRVVPIKDIKTFVRCLRTVVRAMPHVEGWIIGPEDEDPAYAADCRALVRGLGLESSVRFLGFQRADEILPKLGLAVLTSISEALPLFVLEAFAAGLPVVATDVGSCRELIEGRDADDRRRGVAGAVTPIADPGATAAAALTLLTDAHAWQRASAAAIARVEALYTRDQMYGAYRALYQSALEPTHGRDRVRAA